MKLLKFINAYRFEAAVFLFMMSWLSNPVFFSAFLVLLSYYVIVPKRESQTHPYRGTRVW